MKKNVSQANMVGRNESGQFLWLVHWVVRVTGGGGGGALFRSGFRSKFWKFFVCSRSHCIISVRFRPQFFYFLLFWGR